MIKKYFKPNLLFLGLFVLSVSVLTVWASLLFKGDVGIYLMFTVVCQSLLLLGFSKNKIFFDTFIGLFFWLGFWLKFTTKIIFNDSIFWDPVGIFDYRAESFNQALIIATLGVSGLIIARLIRQKWFFTFNKIEIKNTLSNSENFYNKYRAIILILFVAVVAVFSLTNAYYGIYQRGRISQVQLPFWISGTYSWLLFFGFTSFSAYFLNFELKKVANPYFLTTLSLLETFFSNIAMLSRGLILNCSSLFLGLWYASVFKKNKFSSMYKIVSLVTFLILFIGSMFFVNYLRSFYYSSGTMSTANILDVKRKFKENPGQLDSIVISIGALFIDRWVGMEGVFAVSSYKEKGWPLFSEALSEKYLPNGTSLYDKKIATDSPYLTMDESKHHFISLPGIMAFLYYPGSVLFLFFAMTSIGLLGSVFEWIVYKYCNGNLILCSLIGQVVAYRYVHFGYVPRQSYLLFGTILVNIFIFIFFEAFLKLINKKKTAVSAL